MKLAVCEFVTGGGFLHRDLPETLVKEGDMMLRALLSDCADLDDVTIITCRDHRLPDLSGDIQVITVQQNAEQCWQSLFNSADYVLPVAPETDQALLNWIRMSEQHGCTILASSVDAVEMTSSKSRCNQYLRDHGIAVPESLQQLPNSANDFVPYVIKSDEGAGSDQVYFIADSNSEQAWLSTNQHSQAWYREHYVEGTPASMTLFCLADQVMLLSVNEQLFQFENGRGRLHGLIVNQFTDQVEPLAELARSIKTAIAGLRGFIGVDLVFTRSGPVVIEINPRLTTAYVGLRASLQFNPATLLHALMQPSQFHLPNIESRQPVRITLA